MNRFFYIFTQWKICLLLSLLFMGCDNSDNIEKPNRLNDPLAKELHEIYVFSMSGGIEGKEDSTKKALEKVSEFLERHPNNASALKLKSMLYNYLNDPFAQERFKISTLAVQGAIERKKDIMEEALKMASELMKRHPNNVEALRLRSNIYGYLGRPYEELADLEKANQIDLTGASKFYECTRRDELPESKKDSNLSKACFQEAVKLLKNELEYPEKDFGYILANILAGNKEEVLSYFEALVVEDRKNNGYLDNYEGVAQEFFGKTLDELFPPKNK